MDENFKYNQYKHKQTSVCWFIINIVLTLAYVIEIAKGLRGLDYIIAFWVVTWSPWTIFNVCRCMFNVSDTALEYIAGIGYLFFYSFAIITSNTSMSFCYIFPMLTILTVYSNKILNAVVMLISIIINVVIVISRMLIYGMTSAPELTDFEIQIFCLILCTVFLWRSSKVLMLRDDMIESLANDAYYDMLTKIHNRMYLSKLDKHYREEGKSLRCLAIIDIDKFKEINDSYGHQAGDDALVKVAELMVSVTKHLPNTIPIRLGGDEFIIVSTDVWAGDLLVACSKLKKKLTTDKVKAPDGTVIPLTISVGITNGFDGAQFDDLYNKCDELLYDAKESGRDAIRAL